MFKPRYATNAKILTNISEIERLYGRLEGMRIPKQLQLHLERENVIQSSFASNSIEGNPLSQAEVSNLLLGDRIPANRDEKEVVNYFQIVKTLDSEINKPFNVSLILNIHSRLLAGIHDEIKGKIREKHIVVGSRDENDMLFIKHNPPYHTKSEIKEAVLEMLDWLQKTQELPILKIGIFHHRFVYIHPFEDGNGRVCRLLTALLFLKHGYLINKYFVLDDYYDIDRTDYSDKLHSADTGNQTQWLEYFTDGVKYSLQSALGKIEIGLTKLAFDVRPTPKERTVLEIIQKYRELTSHDLTKELPISRQQAFNLLKSLTEKGYIEKKGSTKNSYYVLKK